jgi:hypothetical protein
MADITTDGKTRICWVPSISDISAPTVAEISAGVDLEDYITPDGVTFDFSNTAVDVTALSGTFSSTLPGRQELTTELTLKDQGRNAEPWSTFAGKPDGFLVVRRNVDVADAYATSDLVEVYVVQAGQRKPMAPAANEVAKFSIGFFHTGSPDKSAVVA